jgi:hypothetical protein
MTFENHSCVFNPSDLGLLQRVFEQLCGERRLGPGDTEQRDDLAGEIVRAFQRGVIDETELKEMLRSGAGSRQRGVCKDAA